MKDPFWQNIRWKLGDGSKVRFWFDKWVEDGTLEAIYPMVVDLSLNLPSTIDKQGFLLNGTWQWHLLINRPSIDVRLVGGKFCFSLFLVLILCMTESINLIGHFVLLENFLLTLVISS